MIDRQQELEKLLENLKKSDTEDNSDIDLILRYLENYINNPSIGGGSKKLQEFQIENDPVTLTKIYHVTWTLPLNISTL
jgi:hypothetical protein